MAGDSAASVFTGRNPFLYAPKAPLPLFIVQALIVILMCRLLHLGLQPLRQPRVIAEVIGGIILGPSVLGRIPGYLPAIFPNESIVFLQLVAEIGLVFFLFLVGLELDLRTLRHNARVAVAISVAGIMIPMAVSAVASYVVYSTLTDQSQNFPTFVLFMAVAMSITAFPVLARILTELKLLQTHVGGITISAAAFDDATAWCLLALVMSILNAKDNLTILWILLTGIAYSCFLYFVVRPLFARLERRNRTEHGPSQSIVLVTIMLVLTSAFITDALGVHAIFGAFLIGVMMPNDGGFAIGITEKIEDFVNLLFLPLYFTLSGLRTNISLLSDGITWAMLALVVFVAFAGKLLGCVAAARYYNMSWRESGAIGVLMSCKGLVELIVLNLGLDAGIINDRVFVVMVMMAIITTFLTVPLSTRIYPEQYHQKMTRKNAQDDDAAEDIDEVSPPNELKQDAAILPWEKRRLRVLVTLTGMQQVPALMTLVQLLKRRGTSHYSNGDAYMPDSDDNSTLHVLALRLIELSDRTSTIMMASECTLLHTQDSVLNVFRTFSQLSGVAIRSQAVVASKDDFSGEILNQAKSGQADLVLLPWQTDDGHHYRGHEGDNPLAHLFVQKHGSDRHHHHSSPVHAAYIAAVFEASVGRVGVLVDHGFASAKGIRKAVGNQTDVVNDMSKDSLALPAGAASNSTLTEKAPEAKPSPPTLSPVKDSFDGSAALQDASTTETIGANATTHHTSAANNISHIFVPFFGGPDDRAALKLAVTLSTGGFGLGVSVLRTLPKDESNPGEGNGTGSSSDGTARSSESDHRRELEADLRLLQALFPVLVDSPNAASATAGFHSYATVNAADPRRSVASEFAQLCKKNLAVVGRRREGPEVEIGETKDVEVAEVNAEERTALGTLASELLAIRRRASVLVVQAAAEKAV